MKCISPFPKWFLAAMLVACILQARGDNATLKVFSGIDISNQSNAVKAISPKVSVTEFLSELFFMSFSKDDRIKFFGNVNIADIAAGSLVYSEEFNVSKEDWDALVDAFLIRGFLLSLDDGHRKGYEILLLQRPSEMAKTFVQRLHIERPDWMTPSNE